MRNGTLKILKLYQSYRMNSIKSNNQIVGVGRSSPFFCGACGNP